MDGRGLLLLGAAGAVSAPVQADALTAEMNTFRETRDWQTLRRIWSELNRIEIRGDYFTISLETEKGDSIIAALQPLFSAAEYQGMELYPALELAKRITMERVTRMSRINPELMTRMMPPWTSTVRSDLYFNFEAKLQTLAELVRENEISATGFLAAREVLLEKAITVSLLDLVNETCSVPLYDFPIYNSDELTADSVLQRLNMSYQAALDSLNTNPSHPYGDHYKAIVEQHEHFLVEYEAFQATIPAFRMLLEELMEPEL